MPALKIGVIVAENYWFFALPVGDSDIDVRGSQAVVPVYLFAVAEP